MATITSTQTSDVNINADVNANRLFYGSCFALITTAFTFSIRAGILPQLGTEFGLSAEQLGWVIGHVVFGLSLSL
jgi:putative MFS transporter